MKRFPIILALLTILLSDRLVSSALAENASAKPELRHLLLSMVPGEMRYDKKLLEVEPGQKVKLELDNIDDLQHNLVLLDRDESDPDGQKYAAKCIGLGAEGFEKKWVFESPRVLAHSSILEPHTKEEIIFTAPTTQGEYVYLCSFPGHSKPMQGRLRVRPIQSQLSEVNFKIYPGRFTELPDFATLNPVQSGSDKTIDKLGLVGSASEKAIVWTGKFEVPASGKWNFNIGSKDGMRLIIDGKQVIESNNVKAYRDRKTEVELKQGVHTFKLLTFDNGGRGELHLTASMEGQQPILFTPKRAAAAGSEKIKLRPVLIRPSQPDEAVVFRTFLEGRSPRSIAVSFPNGRNISWNGDCFDLDLLWTHDFLDASENWNRRGASAKVAGKNIISLEGGMPFQELKSADTPWVDYSLQPIRYATDTPREKIQDVFKIAIPHKDYKLHEIQLDEKKFPHFKYYYKNVLVTDKILPDQNLEEFVFHRTLTLDSPLPANTFFLIAAGKNIRKLENDWYQIQPGLRIKSKDLKPEIRTATAHDVIPAMEKGEAGGTLKRQELVLSMKGTTKLELSYQILVQP